MSTPPKENLESILQKVNSYITLKKHERDAYTKAFDAVRNHIISKMCEEDKVFKELSRGHSLGGSYADNLKVTKPDEFDLVVHIKIRYRHLVKIVSDPERPGYVKINLVDVLDKLSQNNNDIDIHRLLLRLVDSDKNLIQNKMQSWIEGIVAKVLNNYPKEITSESKTYSIEKGQKCGPAHTLHIRGPDIGLSIDFVPGLIFNCKEPEWPVSRPCPPYKNQDWIAIPKPVKGSTQDNIYFITSFPSEAYFIEDKFNLKNTLKMMKKLRNCQGIDNLKSYFIKTAYLLETDKVDPDFWSSNSASFIFMYMFDRILTYVKNKDLPFFWSKEFNQFQSLTSNQLDNMYGELKKRYDYIQKHKDSNPSEIYKLFLSPEEMEAQTKGLTINEETRDSWWSSSFMPFGLGSEEPMTWWQVGIGLAAATVAGACAVKAIRSTSSSDRR